MWELIVNIWNIVAVEPMLNSLLLLYGYVFPNLGIAILAFTIIEWAILLPLWVRQSRHWKAIADLQPMVKQIRERYPEDKEIQSRIITRIYKRRGVNPRGAFLPALLEGPMSLGIWMAIHQILSSTPEGLIVLSGHLYTWLPGVGRVIPMDSSFIWLSLAERDSTYILPTLLGFSVWLRFWIVPKINPPESAPAGQALAGQLQRWFSLLSLVLIVTLFPIMSGWVLYWIARRLLSLLTTVIIVTRRNRRR